MKSIPQTTPKKEAAGLHRIGTLIVLLLFFAVPPFPSQGRQDSEGEKSPDGEVSSAELPPRETEVRFPPVNHGPTPITAVPDWEVKTFRIPAARSLILSAEGVPLAIHYAARRLVYRLAEVADSAEEAVEKVRALPGHFGAEIPLLSLSEDEIARHFTHRPWIPLAISEVVADELLASLKDDLPPGCALDSLHVREYPEGELTAHLIGYTGVALPDQRGPVAEVEYTWPPTEGRAGMETTLDEQIRGVDGEVLRLLHPSGRILHQEIVREPKPGNTIVLSIHLELQRLVRDQLAASGRPGAFVAVDADTGDILAMVSHPSFDPNLFEGGISKEDYTTLSERADAPLFDRAVTGAYPPGSTFKSFVALAGMHSGHIDGDFTRYSGPSGMMIAGRHFKNWSSQSEGPMDVRYALIRSCNTWFYQAALDMGANPISEISSRFGFGVAPELPLPSVSPGNIPESETYNDPRSLANYAIGQGRVLASPLQMAFAMAGIANGDFVPRPRLIREKLDPKTGKVAERVRPAAAHRLGLSGRDIDLVRDGLWGVVNYSNGTAGRASMSNPVVYGKTGTSQWSTGGEMRSLAWFTGWVDAREPRIAFAVVTQGRPRETLSGGRNAAPIAAGVLRKAYGDPETYAVTLPEGPSRDRPAIIAAVPVLEDITPDESVEQRPRRGLLRFLFGGGR